MERNDKTYGRARRSLMIFPIKGNSESDMTVNLVAFLRDVLCLPGSEANGGIIENVRRAAANKYYCLLYTSDAADE